ncbi:MAG: hypothetical protein ACRD2B_15720 [Terriglobia bacterium]
MSHRSCQHLPDLLLAYPPPLDPTDHHGQIADDVGIELHPLPFRGPWTWVGPSVALAVLQFLLPLTLRGAVVGHAALSGISPPVRLATSKRAPQIPAPPVPGMSQEKNATLSATTQTGTQMRVGAEDRPQLDVVLPDQSADAAAAIPIRDALKLLLDFND